MSRHVSSAAVLKKLLQPDFVDGNREKLRISEQMLLFLQHKKKLFVCETISVLLEYRKQQL